MSESEFGSRRIGTIYGEGDYDAHTSVETSWEGQEDEEFVIIHVCTPEGVSANHVLSPFEALELAHYLRRAAGLALERFEEAPDYERESTKHKRADA